MKRGADRVGQIILLLIGIGLVASGGMCVINLQHSGTLIMTLPLILIGLGLWVVSLVRIDGDKVSRAARKEGQSAEKEKQ